jgi:hypothetical protein
MASDPTRIGASTDFDTEIWSKLEAIAESCDLDFSEKIELWPLFLRRVSFSRFIALYEIFKLTKDMPGFIVECGVFKGQSLGLFRQLLEIYSHGDSLKKIIGFDTFSGFVGLSSEDGPPDSTRAKAVGGWDASNFLTHLESLLDVMQIDSYMPRVKRVELVKGDVSLTIPKYVADNPGLRISLLNLDLDLFEPTTVALQHLFPLVVQGGVVIFDEYGMPGFPGESAAAEKYFGNALPVLTKFNFSPTPGGFFIKN